MELFAAFEGSVASTAGIVKAAPSQLDAPTPCAEWDVRALLNHVIGTLWLAEALFSDQPPRYPMAPGGLPPADLAGDNPAAAYAEALGEKDSAAKLRAIVKDIYKADEFTSQLAERAEKAAAKAA